MDKQERENDDTRKLTSARPSYGNELPTLPLGVHANTSIRQRKCVIQFDAPLIQPKRNRLSALEAKVAATQPSFLATIGGRVPDADLKKPGEWKVADLQTALQQTWLLDELETKITRAMKENGELNRSGHEVHAIIATMNPACPSATGDGRTIGQTPR